MATSSASAAARLQANNRLHVAPHLAGQEYATMPDPHKEIIKAAKSGDLASIRMLLELDATLIGARDKDGSTPLHCAVWKGHQAAHLDGKFPSGGNNLYLDGHTQWITFQQMRVRTRDNSASGAPAFWW